MKLLIGLAVAMGLASAGAIGTYNATGNTYNADNSTASTSTCTGATNMLCSMFLDGTAGLQSLVVILSNAGVSYGDVVFTTDIGNTADTSAWIYELIFPNDGAGISHHVQLVSNESPLFQDLTQVSNVPNAFVAGQGGLTATTPEPATFGLAFTVLVGLVLAGEKKRRTQRKLQNIKQT